MALEPPPPFALARYSFGRTLFSAADITTPPPEGCTVLGDAAAAAVILGEEIERALIGEVLRSSAMPTGSDAAEWAGAVARAAERLLALLGVPMAADFDAGVVPLSIALPAVAALNSAGRIPAIPLDEDGPDMGYDQSEPSRYIHQRQLLAALPRAVGAAAFLAREKKRTQPDSQRGRPNDVFLVQVFAALADAHLSVFGRSPKTRDNADKRRGPSIAWAKNMCALAVARINRDGAWSGAADAIKRLRGLAVADTDTTLANWLERAAQAQKRATK